jgi:cytochrome c-type biogenesis protein CcmH/NrfG
MQKEHRQHLKSNNNIISKLAVIVLSIVLLTGLALVPVLQIEVSGQVQQQQQQQQQQQPQQQKKKPLSTRLSFV